MLLSERGVQIWVWVGRVDGVGEALGKYGHWQVESTLLLFFPLADA